MERIKKPKYLIKFCRQLSHAQMLLDGYLFMRPASAFHSFETNYGDKKEASLLSWAMIYKNPNCYIYCLSAIFENKINGRLIDHFNCEDGFIVIINYDDFSKLLSKENLLNVFSNHSCSYGLVQYGEKGIEFAKQALLDKIFDSTLFTKSSFFEMEQEFRIATDERYDENIESLDVGLKDVNKVFYLGKNIRSISTLIDIKSMKEKVILLDGQEILIS